MKRILFLVVLAVLAVSVSFSASVSEVLSDALATSFSYLYADTAVGAPIEAGELIIIPLFKAQTGFGVGAGGPEGEVYGGGAGGGVDLLPYAVIVISPDGVSSIPVLNEKPFFEQLVDSIPKLLPYVKELMKYFTAVPQK